ncbi:MAG: homoserine kinase [Acidobacteria bacterium]|nr:homoserine kinase [Acidobacteriota bacterium]
MFQIKVPATSANLGAGFDCFGLALKLYLTVRVKTNLDQIHHKIELSGQGVESLPTDENNLILKVANFVAQKENIILPKLYLEVENHLPLARGLGSSAGAITAGIAIVEALEKEFSSEKFFSYARHFENHLDNIAAARYGAFTIAVSDKEGLAIKQKWPEKIKALVLIPDFQLDTQKARGVLPTSYSRSDAIFNLQHALLFQASIMQENYSLIGQALEDRWHQNFRAPLVPGLQEALTIKMPGLLGVALSGSGPAILALALENFSAIAEKLKQIFAKQNIKAETKLLEIDQQGRAIEFFYE